MISYLRVLQHIFHFGPDEGSRSNIPSSHEGQWSTDNWSLLWGQEEWGHVEQVISFLAPDGGWL